MIIKIKRLTKKNYYKPNDLKKWVEWLNDKKVTKFSEQRFSKHSITSQKKFLKDKVNESNSIVFKIFCDKVFVGLIEIANIDLNHLNCELMYIIGETCVWSKGVATEAIKLSINYVKQNLKMN